MELSRQEIHEKALEWLRLDQDPQTRDEIERLVREENHAALAACLHPRIAFGTAGLRARMGAGFARMNCLTIIQTSQGLGRWAVAQSAGSGDAQAAGVVIGYDARHNSRRFAELVAATFLKLGFRIWWMEDVVHTPLVPFAVRHQRAALGIMITASHNPAQDNGYKVYGQSSCQINSPLDQHISQYILRDLEPLTWDISNLSQCQNVRASILSKYQEVVSKFVFEPPPFVYTPLHGVGQIIMETLVVLTPTPSQATPDPDFPTLKYPNPEEHGALEQAKLIASQRAIRLVIANDPDADRMAAAEHTADGWVQFTGDQMGILLADYIMSQTPKPPRAVVLSSAVSSQMLSRIAQHYKYGHEETLTGFKWLGERALHLAQDGRQCVFAYEEALGYMFPEVVMDKDGILAALVFLKVCKHCSSPWRRLQELYAQFGHHVTRNTYWRSPSVHLTDQIFHSLHSKERPQIIAGRHVVRWRDLTTGIDTAGEPNLPCSTTTHMITCWLAGSGDDGVRFTVRASGTEPKIKLYLECSSVNEDAAVRGANHVLEAIANTWFADEDLKRE